MKNKTPISDFSEVGRKKLHEMSENSTVFTQFLKFLGRVFKHNTNVALEFFAQKPDTLFIATQKQWENSGRKVAVDSEAISFTDRNGKTIDYFDFSQLEKSAPPPIWTINAENAAQVKSELGLNKDKSIISGLIENTVNPSNITECMNALKIPPNEYNKFGQAFMNNIQLVIAGRLEIGGNNFMIKPDNYVLNMLKDDNQKLFFLTYISKMARNCLMKVEKAMQKISAAKINEKADNEEKKVDTNTNFEEDKNNTTIETPVQSDTEKAERQNPVEDNLSDEDRLVSLNIEIKDKKIDAVKLLNDNRFSDCIDLLKEINTLKEKADILSEKIGKRDLKREDIERLREVTSRKSIQNLTEPELAMVAPLEKHLSEELGEKSPFEMRKTDNAWRSDETKRVPIIEVKKQAIPENITELRKNSDIVRGDFINKDTGFTINVGAKSISETIAKAINDKKHKYNVDARLSALFNLQPLIENAVEFDTQIAEAKKKSPNRILMHRMYGIFQYDGEPYLANMAILENCSENKSGDNYNTQHNFYSLRDIKITPIEEQGFQSLASTSNDVWVASQGADISIPQLYKIVKTFDKNFFENPQAVGREEREAELLLDAKYKDAVKAFENGNAKITPDEETKQLERFADIRGITVEEVKPIIEQNIDTYINFSGNNEEQVETAFAEAVHKAFEEVKNKPNRTFTDNQSKYLERLEKFVIQNNVTYDVIDSSFKKSDAFKSNYVNKKVLSKLFVGRLQSLEKEIENALKKALNELKQQKKSKNNGVGGNENSGAENSINPETVNSMEQNSPEQSEEAEIVEVPETDTIISSETESTKKHVLSVGDIISLPNMPNEWQVTEMDNMKISLQNTSTGDVSEIFDFSIDRDKLEYTLISHSDKIPEQAEINETPVEKTDLSAEPENSFLQSESDLIKNSNEPPESSTKTINITENSVDDTDFEEEIVAPEIITPTNPIQRIYDNISAIKEMKRLEQAEADGTDPYDKKSNQYNSRQNSDERLRKYSGWGGLSKAFEENTWYNAELKKTLTPEEYNAAKSSTLNAHYTPQFIIDAMYKAATNMGLPRNSRILEPSCGTGNFISRIPHSLGNTEIVGVELDSITARIARQLNKDNSNVRIVNSGFEDTKFENNSFDLAIGNVPFGDYNLNDPDYVQDWRIHDAFFRKALDKVSAGGMVAFVTSCGTMDKKNPKIREYLATQAELVGAIRFPETAFSSAGTKTPTDIIFLKKRDTPLSLSNRKPDWCYTATNSDGLRINSYFLQNPQMVLGKMEKTGHFDILTCKQLENTNVEKMLNEAIKNLNAKITVERREKRIQEQRGIIEAWGKNYAFQVKDDKVYYRIGEEMKEIKCNKEQKEIIKKLCDIRNITRQLLDMQKTSATDEELMPLRDELNKVYDEFVAEHGNLTNNNIKKLFRDDTDFPILQALEKINSEAETVEKADIFYRRTVNPTIEISKVETPEQALQISLDKKGKPDIPYMAELLSDTPENVCNELLKKGYIFIDPEKQVPDKAFSGVTEQSEYLSGNVRMKLTIASEYAKTNPKYERNIQALEKVIPEDIKAEEISVQLGCSWIDTQDYTDFLAHLSGRQNYNTRNCEVTYSAVTGEFDILNAGSRKELNVNETSTYGTADMNMYKIAERLLNQRRIVIQQTFPNPNDPTKKITRTDPKATKLAMEKAKLIKAEFKKWIFADPARKEKYERKYNNIFNSLVGREYDGSNLTFAGMSTGFNLRPHQKNCIARAIYGGNTLAAHIVGAGKSAVMFSTVMKKKELGLINKACVVVPKALTEQTAAEWQKVFPDAKLLTVTNDDLSTEEKRKLFTARVATGSYDAVIMSQEQFEKIPMSKEYRAEFLQKELDSLEDMMREKKKEGRGKKDFTVRAIESAKKKLTIKIQALTDPKAAAKAKDNFLEFEQLGFDYLVCDEAHAYKNGFVTTKMQNVAGVTTKPSGRAEDMQMKTDYFNEQLGNGHILYCTGTPVSNSMTELYVMTRYLRPDLLKQSGVERFDDWAATFGNVVSKNQQAADGKLKLRTSFSSFANLPELMAMYKEFADIQSADKLNLPRPELKTGKPQIIKVKASPEQKQYVKNLAERAELIERGAVTPEEDNLLKITGEARLIGLGNKAVQALYAKRGEELPDGFVDSKDSKIDKCIEKVAEIYKQTEETKGVQIIFSDVAVNDNNGNFSAYDYIKKELSETYGIPENEIIFAPKSDAKNREEIFRDINNSKYRVIIASTETLGTGANIQQNLYALHHLDIPWKPSDFEQREGRILRQGNQNSEVEIFNYVTEGTLDSYLYQTVLDKARFIAQLMDNKCPARVSADCDEKVLTFGELQAAAEDNEDFKKRIELSNDIAELDMLRSEYNHETAIMQQKIKELPFDIEMRKSALEKTGLDKKSAEKIREISIELKDGRTLTDRKEINTFLFKMVQDSMKNPNRTSDVIKVGNFKIFASSHGDTKFYVEGKNSYNFNAGATENQDNYQRLANFLEKTIAKKETEIINDIQNLTDILHQAEERVKIPFPHEEELEMKIQDFQELDEKLAELSNMTDDVYDAEEVPNIEDADENNSANNGFDDDDFNPNEEPPKRRIK